MLEIIGNNDSSEHDVARRLAESLKCHWRGIDKSPESEECVKISVGAKLSGYPISDIDIVIAAKLAPGRRFVPTRVVKDSYGRTIMKRPVEVSNFIVAIEIKDHDAEQVQYSGDQVSVFYSKGSKKGWKSATDQNIKQVHALTSYFHDHLNEHVWVYRCLILNGVDKVNLSGALARTFNAPQFLTACTSVNNIRSHNGCYWMSSSDSLTSARLLKLPIFKVFVPTNLDRRRMDALASQSGSTASLLESLGSCMSIIRGYGGTGKTILLLQTVIQAFKVRGDRSLVLTYNVALASDIRRSLTLLSVPSNPDEGGVTVNTVMSFTLSWLDKIGLITKSVGQLSNYKSLCEQALELISQGAITESDILDIKRSDPDTFDFDNIAIDEAQDWPKFESDLLLRLYDGRSLIVADGIDQNIRGKRTEWRPLHSNIELNRIYLDTSLRMKSNLTRFAIAIAGEAKLQWHSKTNPFAGGGKVIVTFANPDDLASLYVREVTKSRERGNCQIDSLICVPNMDIRTFNRSRVSALGQRLMSRNLLVWDGTDKLIRKNHPSSTDQNRIVHYASCRGLEGWVTLLYRADSYWQDCYEERMNAGQTELDALALISLEEAAEHFAWNRLMIAMTRPIDTLIISLKDDGSPFCSVLLSLAKRFPDVISIES